MTVCTFLNIMYYIDKQHKSVSLPFQYLLCLETAPGTQACWGEICVIQSVASILKKAPISNLPPVFEALCWGGNLFLGGWMLWWGRPKMQIRILQSQYLQKFNERPENGSILSPPSHHSHGQRAALQPWQQKACLEGRWSHRCRVTDGELTQCLKVYTY